MNFESLHAFAHAASTVGAWVLGVVVSVMAIDGILLVIFSFRHGQSDANEGKTVTVDRPMWPMWFRGIQATRGWSRRRALVGRSGFISIESLADGTATLAERLVVSGILVFIVCFVLLFFGAGLLFLEDNPLVVLMPVIVGIWAFKLLKTVYDDYRRARRTVAARHGSADDDGARPHT